MAINGAHLLSYAADTEGELFYLSERAQIAPGSSIRGGVPVIAPWFAGLTGQQPSHGWARRSRWEIDPGAEVTTARLVHDGLGLKLCTRPLSDGLEMMLTCRNLDQDPRMVQLALHPYFRVGDVAQASVRGLEQSVNALQGAAVAGQPGAGKSAEAGRADSAPGDVPIRFAGEVDLRVPLAGTVAASRAAADREKHPVVELCTPERVLGIELIGADHAVVWNPGEALAETMMDVAPGSWRHFVCVEPALLGEPMGESDVGKPPATQAPQGVRLAPGEECRVGMRVTVRAAGSDDLR